jgi:hypothetical protein
MSRSQFYGSYVIKRHDVGTTHSCETRSTGCERGIIDLRRGGVIMSSANYYTCTSLPFN